MTVSVPTLFTGVLPAPTDPSTFDARMALLLEYLTGTMGPEFVAIASDLNAALVGSNNFISAVADCLRKGQNLADLTDKSAARQNLGFTGGYAAVSGSANAIVLTTGLNLSATPAVGTKVMFLPLFNNTGGFTIKVDNGPLLQSISTGTGAVRLIGEGGFPENISQAKFIRYIGAAGSPGVYFPGNTALMCLTYLGLSTGSASVPIWALERCFAETIVDENGAVCVKYPDGSMTCTMAVLVTPTAANTPKSLAVTWPAPFKAAPAVVVTANTTVVGTYVTGVASSSATATGALVWVTRINTSGTGITVFATGRWF